MGNKKGYWAGARNPKYQHGMAHTKIYSIWSGMMARCYNPKRKLYQYYGARGITVCKRWHNIHAFHADMGEPPEGASIERKDNDRGYTPKNCTWADRNRQANNTRANLVIECNGVRMTAAQWARTLGIPYNTIRHRLHHGWPKNMVLKAANFRGQKFTWANKK